MINPPLLDYHFPPLEQPDPPPEPAPKREECKDKSEYELGQLEANTVASACVFVLAIAVDALCALPAVGVADVPTSLRVTSLVLVALVAAPPVEAGLLFEQRFGAVLLLGAASPLSARGGFSEQALSVSGVSGLRFALYRSR